MTKAIIGKIMQLPTAVRVVAPVIAVGLCFGLGVGLYIGWMAWPVQVTNVDINDLKESAQADYIVLTAKTFAFDQNLDSARARLKLLSDANVAERVANLALLYRSENKPESAQLASLAFAMGSTKAGIALIAATPEPVAQAVLPEAPTATLVNPLIAMPALVPNSLTATPIRAITAAVTRTPTRRLTATATKPPSAPIAPTVYLPGDIQKGWPGGFHIEPAAVAAGQQFWHVTKAIYCDYPETLYGCTGKGSDPLPGGPGTIGVWVKLVGGKAPLVLDGKPANLEDKSSDTECQCTYSLAFPGPTIEVSGHPSEKIFGAANATAVRGGFPNQHVRYFFTYQLITR